MSFQLATTVYLQGILSKLYTNSKLSQIIGNKIVRVRPNHFIFKPLTDNQSLCIRCGTVYIPNVTFYQVNTTDIKTIEKLKQYYPKKKIGSSVVTYICKTCKFKFHDVHQCGTESEPKTADTNKKMRFF